MAGQEDFALRLMEQSDVLDRRFDGYLPDTKHFAQNSIIPMKLYCNNKVDKIKCEKYYKDKHQYLGSCFLIKELNEDETCEYLYFATAAHNLFCAYCKTYRWVKPILKWRAGQRQADDFLLGEKDRGVSESSFYGWMKVSKDYTQKCSPGGNSRECYPFDYGILAVKIAGIGDAKSYAARARKKFGMFAAPAERHDLKFVKRAYLCGYPGDVCNQNENEPPQGPPANAADLEYMGPKRLADGYFQWKVQGGRFWMPSDRSSPGQEPTDTEKPSERSKKERRTAALYPLPQRHERGTCAEQDSQLNKDRLYRHYIDCSDGQSGSPVYLCEPDDDDVPGQQCVAMGIHVGAWYGAKGQKKAMGFNVAVRLPGDVLREMESWVRDPSNKASDQSEPLPDVDILEDTEDYDLGCQPPTFFGGNMEQPGAGAAAQADPPKLSQPRTADPWKSTEYLHNYQKLLTAMDPEQVKAACKTLGFLKPPYFFKQRIDAERERNKKNEVILDRFETWPRDRFGVFREILRHGDDCEAIVDKLDLVGPDPATDAGCLKARKTLEKASAS